MTIVGEQTRQPGPGEDAFSGAQNTIRALHEVQHQPAPAETQHADEFFKRMSSRMIRMAREDSDRRSLRPANEVMQLIDLMKERAAFADDRISYSNSNPETELEEQSNLESSLLGAARACLNARDNYGGNPVPFFDTQGLPPEQVRDLKSQLNLVFGNLSGDGQTDIPGVALDFFTPDAQHPDRWLATLSFAPPMTEPNPVLRTVTEANPVAGPPTADMEGAPPEPNYLVSRLETVARKNETVPHGPVTKDSPVAAPAALDEARSHWVTAAEKQPEPAERLDLTSLRTKGALLYGHMFEGRGRLHEDGADPEAYAAFMNLLRQRAEELNVGPEPDFITSQDKSVTTDGRERTPAIAVHDALNEASLFVSPWKGGQLHERSVIFTGHPKESLTSLVQSELVDFFQPDLASLQTTVTSSQPGETNPDEIISTSTFQLSQMPGFILRLEHGSFAERVRTVNDQHRPDELRVVLERQQPAQEKPAEAPAQPAPRLRDRIRNIIPGRRSSGKRHKSQ